MKRATRLRTPEPYRRPALERRAGSKGCESRSSAARRGPRRERSPGKELIATGQQWSVEDEELDCGAKPRGRENGAGATAAVTQCGCGRVDFFEGCEPRRGDLRFRPNQCRRPKRLAEMADDARGNATNPMIGSGVQQTRDSRSGASRRGGAKPRGRNAMSRLEAPTRTAARATVMWRSGRPRACRLRDEGVGSRGRADRPLLRQRHGGAAYRGTAPGIRKAPHGARPRVYIASTTAVPERRSRCESSRLPATPQKRPARSGLATNGTLQ